MQRALLPNESGGLVHYDGYSWNVYDPSNSDLPADWVESVIIDTDGGKWVGTLYGLALFEDNFWTQYNTSNSGLPHNEVLDIALDVNDDKWIGTWGSEWEDICIGGLAYFDDDNWTVYNTDNSGLPCNDISAVAVEDNGMAWIGTYWSYMGVVSFDGNNWNNYITGYTISDIEIENDGTKWVGTHYGLAKYNNSSWYFYTTGNSGLPDNYVTSIVIDDAGKKWIGTDQGGVAVFDNSNWTVYNTSNSGLHNNQVISIAIDQYNVKWIGTTYGASSYDGDDWETFIFQGLTRNVVKDIAVDINNIVWFGTGNGLGRYDRNEWTWHTIDNSGLPMNYIMCLAVDNDNTKWIGTFGGGMASYTDPITGIEKEINVVESFSISQNYPNPFNASTSIRYALPEESHVKIIIYDLLGRKASILVDEKQQAGYHEITWNASGRTSGIYFARLETEELSKSIKMILLK
jgi:ligand-binding sensor domain-containing protein